MRRWDWDSYPKPPRRAPPKHGIRVKKIGATWWGQRWIEALERLSRDYLNRMGRGRTYARTGRVHDLKIAANGRVTALVTGSSSRPYKVTISLIPLSEQAWKRATLEMAGMALYAAELLAGRMPREIDDAFRAGKSSVFPTRTADIETDCSCPDWANPCKHVAAVHYVLGEALDKDPFLLFELRGRGRERVLADLRRLRSVEGAAGGSERDAARSDSAHDEDDELPASMSLAGMSPHDYERAAARPGALHLRIEPPAISAAVLRALGNPPGWTLEETPAELLEPLYRAAGEMARELALGTSDRSESQGDDTPKGVRSRLPGEPT